MNEENEKRFQNTVTYALSLKEKLSTEPIDHESIKNAVDTIKTMLSWMDYLKKLAKDYEKSAKAYKQMYENAQMDADSWREDYWREVDL